MKREIGMNMLMLFLAVLVIAVVSGGCGEAKKEAGDLPGTVPIEDAANVGADNCKICHSALTHTELSAVAGINPDASGLANAITHDCEACHGGGQYHFGPGPIPYPTPGLDRCATCHSEQVSKMLASKHNGEEPENTEMTTTGHTGGSCQSCHTLEGYVEYAKVVVDGVLTGYTALDPAPATFHYPGCAACHNPLTADLRKTPSWDPNNNAKSDQFDMCTSCHKLIMPVTGQPIASGETVNGVLTAEMQQHKKDWYRNITNTHYDMPETWGQSDSDGNGSLDRNSMVEGYIVRMNKDTACTDCHGHELFTNTGGVASAAPSEGTIHTEWAQSGHAGKLLSKKIALFATQGYSRTTTNAAAIMAVYTDDADGVAWTHYNWDQSSRASCQRCHTATGAANYLSAPATYSAANNDFTHMIGWNATDGSKQQELLYCWGCHVSVETGELHQPGAITASYNFNGAPAQFPDAGSSNVCIACHAGRESGESIPLTGLNSASFKNSHYMAAAGLMYVKIGFIAFTDPSTPIGSSTYGASLTSTEDGGALSSTHRKFGSTAMVGDHGITASDTQFLSGGPCVTCHLTKIGDMRHHTLEIDEYAINNVCLKCHDEEGGVTLDDTNFDTLFLEEQAVPFQNALALALDRLLTNYNISYDPSSHPYFYDETIGGGTAVTDWTRGGALTGDEPRKLMGACFNINVLTRDPAAYVHARTYTRRLIYDTIDFLDDGTINLSTVATAQSVDPANYGSSPPPPDASTASESLKFIKGYSHSTHAWRTPERP